MPKGSTLNTHSKSYERFSDHEVTNEMLDEAAQLFSENYGVWSEQAEEAMGKFAEAGRCSLVLGATTAH